MSKKKRLEKRAQPEKSGSDNKDKSLHVAQRNKISYELALKYPYEISQKQQELFDLITNKESKIIFVNGPAGTSKTLMAAYAGLELLNQKRVSEILYIRSVIESASRSLGHLPGLASEKFEPFTMPLKEKLDELLPAKDVEFLTKDKRVEYIPINFMRGASFNVKYILADECQNFTAKEILTMITRLGRFSKIILCGDAMQSDINGHSGFMKYFDLFNDETSRQHGIHCFSFTRDDIVRSGILKYIMERVENVPNVQRAHEPMFPTKT